MTPAETGRRARLLYVTLGFLGLGVECVQYQEAARGRAGGL